MKWIGLALAALLLVGVYVFYGVLPQRFDRNNNVVIPHEPYEISERARALHETIPVADLHSDMLLWRRDPLKRNMRGHTDLPRLRDGGVALQVFTAVTKTPPDLNYDENEADKDALTLLMIAQAWPVRTWNSIYERAAYQASRLDKLEKRADGGFVYAKTKNDLQGAIDHGALAGVYGIEGAHPLEGDIENLDKLYDAGLRVMGLQHFFDNELGGSLHGTSGAGLTAFGKQAVDRAVEKGMIIDVAHSSEAVVREVLARTDKPVIVSHTGLKGHCDTPRNISDETMKMIADHGGLVGVGFWDAAVCDPTPAGIAGAILYAVELLGVDHVALGSDFDGTVTTPIDGSEMAAITQALIDAGADDETIRAVMGENAVRFFLEHLPG
ncbi:dipeptidase [Hyphococcus flavus]|uniref:Dipeptidase n=1 Tax=Hyphococcus flavus TaxID=1866326 RepID=A0AAF0CF84_9PROT|nr:dipeptidase [Hyphococcus flavus]WDI32261.1 dipeptidase [Hyphococcus flavus]